MPSSTLSSPFPTSSGERVLSIEPYCCPEAVERPLVAKGVVEPGAGDPHLLGEIPHRRLLEAPCSFAETLTIYPEKQYALISLTLLVMRDPSKRCSSRHSGIGTLMFAK
jgi:hypothetical protein